MGRKLKRYEFHGQMLTVAEIAKETGLTAAGVQTRIWKGIPIEMARRFEPVMFHGKESSWKEIEQLSGISKSTIRARMRKLGCTIEQAVKIGKRKRGRERRFIAEDILQAWNEGLTVQEIAAVTGCTRRQINYYLPVEDLEKREVLERYGY